MQNFRDELTRLINRYSKENGSNTPDFILATYLCACLDAFDETVRRRAKWYGRDDIITNHNVMTEEDIDD